MPETKTEETRTVTVGELLMALRQKGDYERLAVYGGWKDRSVRKMFNLGVSLTGHVEHRPKRIQIIGRSEAGYLSRCGSQSETCDHRLPAILLLVCRGADTFESTCGRLWLCRHE